MTPKTILFISTFSRSHQDIPYINDELIQHLETHGWSTVRASSKTNKLLFLLDVVWTIISKRNRYHLAEVDVFSGPAFIWAEVAVQLLRWLKKPVILVLHGGNLPLFSKRHPGRVKRLLSLASRVVTPSAYLFEHLHHIRPDITILPNPIQLENYTFHPRLTPSPRLLWLRAFHEIYNPSLAPRVLHELVARNPGIELTMVGPDKGDGSLQRMLAVADSLQVRDKLKLTGQVPRADVPQWLAGSDIFINTTNIDNTPVSIIEAMAAGMCIVSTNVGGIPCLLEHGVDSLLVLPDDPPAMANAIQKILNDPPLAQTLSTNARRKAEGFSWQVIYPMWETLISQVLQEAG